MGHVIKEDDELLLTNDLFICVYNHNQVGLFKKIEWNTKRDKERSNWYPEFSAGNVYYGVDNNFIGAQTTHCGCVPINDWCDIGTEVIIGDLKFIVNCIMDSSMSFNEFRQLLLDCGYIGEFKEGLATIEDIHNVLTIAYYQTNINQFESDRSL